MNYVINYAVIVCATLLFLIYLGSFILNLVRTVKLKKEIKAGKVLKVDGTITNVVVNKKKVYVQVLYTSPVNKLSYEALFEYHVSDWNDRFKLGDKCEIMYPDLTNSKRCYNFPIFLTGDKVKMPLGATVTDLLLLLFGIYQFVTILIMNINAKAFTEPVDFQAIYGDSMILLIIYVVMHFLLFSYIIQRFGGASPAENENYLQLNGLNVTAEVKTFKFVGSKNARGFKESQMEIEYFDGEGNVNKTRCGSYYYSETQEQYINILYDPKNKKNVVYIKTPEKRTNKVNK